MLCKIPDQSQFKFFKHWSLRLEKKALQIFRELVTGVLEGEVERILGVLRGCL